MTETTSTVIPAQPAASNNMVSNPSAISNHLYPNQHGLPKFDFPSFKPSNYRAWAHMANVFFVRHELFNTVNGAKLNAAGNALRKVIEGHI